MALTAPTRVSVGAATVFEDPDITFDDVNDRLFVTNLEKNRIVTWSYARTEYELIPGAKPKLLPFFVIKHYLGDPRAVPGKQGTFTDKGSQNPNHRLGMVPERHREMRRLAVMYGAYVGLMNKLPTLKFHQLRSMNRPKDAGPGWEAMWDENLPPGVKIDDYVVPRIKVQTESGIELKFPVYEPNARPYRYTSLEVGENEDVRTELDRLRAAQAQQAARIEALLARQGDAGDDEMEATEDVVGGLGGI